MGPAAWAFVTFAHDWPEKRAQRTNTEQRTGTGMRNGSNVRPRAADVWLCEISRRPVGTLPNGCWCLPPRSYALSRHSPSAPSPATSGCSWSGPPRPPARTIKKHVMCGLRAQGRSRRQGAWRSALLASTRGQTCLAARRATGPTRGRRTHRHPRRLSPHRPRALSRRYRSAFPFPFAVPCSSFSAVFPTPI